MKEQLEKLKLKFDDVDPQQISLTEPLQEYYQHPIKLPFIITELNSRLERLEQDSKNLNRKSNYSLQNSDDRRIEAMDLKNRAEELFDDLTKADEECNRVVNEIEKISGQLQEEAGMVFQRIKFFK